MRITPLKRNGKIFVIIIYIFALFDISYSATISAELEDQRISVGESTNIKISVEDGNDIKPVKVPKVPGLDITYVGMGRNIQIINWKKTESTVYTFEVVAERTGKYIIPGFKYEIDGKVYKSNDVSLIVIKGDVTTGKRTTHRVKPEIEVSKEKLLIGESLIVRYYLLSTGIKVNVEGFEKLPETKGFVIKQVEESLPDSIEHIHDRDYIKSHISTFILIPTSSGSFKIGGGTAIISYQVAQGIFPFTQRKRLIYDSKKIIVQQLPEYGKPAEFKGDVGKFSISVDYSNEPIEIYQEKRVTVTVKGVGNFLTMTKPVLESEIPGVRVLSEDGESKIKLNGNNITGEKKIIYSMIPESAGQFELGKFVFCYYNIEKKIYETINSQKISFNVKEGNDAKKGLEFDDDGAKEIEFNPIYIAIILFILAGVIILVVVWERKKYVLAVGNDVKDDEVEDDKKDEREYRTNLRNLGLSVRRDDKNDFFKQVDKVLGYVKNNFNDFDMSNVEEERIDNLKERLYLYKFGGTPISKEEMELIHEEIKEIVKS